VESEALVEALRQNATPRSAVSQFSSSFTESMFLESSDPDQHVHQLLHDARLDVERMKTRCDVGFLSYIESQDPSQSLMALRMAKLLQCCRKNQHAPGSGHARL